MNFQIPTEKQLEEIFPNLEEITFVKKGGFKAVYSAKINGTKEALKLVFIPNAKDLDIKEEDIISARKRVIREIKLLKYSKSPFLVKLGSLKQKIIKIKNDDFIAYSEEFIEGKILNDLIDEAYMPNENELRKLMISMLYAIRELWSNDNVIHRDIKPQNIFKSLEKKREFILFDLGVAFKTNATHLTLDPNMIYGTRHYLAPEMFEANFREKIDFRSDLYTLGLTIYEFASGKHPFFGTMDDPLQTISKILHKTPLSLSELRPDLSGGG